MYLKCGLKRSLKCVIGSPAVRSTAISVYVVGSKPQANTQEKTEGEYGIIMNNYQQN